MKKKIINRYGIHYLLGKNQFGQKVCLQQQTGSASYWEFGLLHAFTVNEFMTRPQDLEALVNLQRSLAQGPEYSYKLFKSYFKETVLSNDEIWELCDYIKTYYTLKDTADLFRRGFSGYGYRSEKAELSCLPFEPFACAINQTMLPELFGRVEKLLCPKNN